MSRGRELIVRKLVAVGLVSFTASVFGVTAVSQPRRRVVRPPVAVAEVPPSPRIAQELGQLRWGLTHEQVIDYFRQTIRAEYLPRMKNLGQIEQFHLVEQRDAEIQRLVDTYVVFDGTPEHRRWDTSFIGDEYTHNNNESMLVKEDDRGNREFFFFINDRLWKRVQARNTNGAEINLASFGTSLERLFGPGRRVMDGPRLVTIEWHDDHTRLHIVDATRFYNAFCLVYEDVATVAQLGNLRRNVPVKTVHVEATQDISQVQVGNTTGDPSPDIVDRITGNIRRVQTTPDAASAPAHPAERHSDGLGATPGTTTPTHGSTAPATGSTGHGGTGSGDNDPLGGLGF